MSRHSFRHHHLLQLLDQYELDRGPFDRLVNLYVRSHRAIGGSDRREITHLAYELMRWQILLDELSSESTWEARLNQYLSIDPWQEAARTDLPPHVRTSCPKPLYEFLEQTLSADQALDFSLTMNTQAPLTVRVNTLKTTREELLSQWKNTYEVEPTAHAPHGIRFAKRAHLLNTEAYQQGLFEMQDEGSQLMAALVEAEPGDTVLDYCAGSGGKALAVAAHMLSRGQIFLHDVRLAPLQEARKRCRRAGVQNAQFLPADDPRLARLKGQVDWLLLDVPCSGSGSWRRHVEAKYVFDPSQLESFVAQQRAIIDQALPYLAPKGRVVYATCSVFPQENQEQLDWMQHQHKLRPIAEPFQSWPQPNQMDGFFGAALQR